jgi:hypothetical protein
MNALIHSRSLTTCALVAIAVMAAPLARPAAAQERPAPVGEFAAGALLFADDGVVTEGLSAGRLASISRRESV